VLEGEAIKFERDRDATDEGGVVLADQEHESRSSIVGSAWPSVQRECTRPATKILQIGYAKCSSATLRRN